MKVEYHELVKQALIDEGWTITDDPLYVKTPARTVEIDLAAERLLTAKRGTEEIAVEIKSFVGISTLHEFYKALGQFQFYQFALKKEKSKKELYLAVPADVYDVFFSDVFMLEFLSEKVLSIVRNEG